MFKLVTDVRSYFYDIEFYFFISIWHIHDAKFLQSRICELLDLTDLTFDSPNTKTYKL